MSDTVTLFKTQITYLLDTLDELHYSHSTEVASIKYCVSKDWLNAALAAPEPQPVKQAEQIKSLREALKAVLAVANVRIDDARIGVFDDARAALALVGDQP